MKRQVVLRIKDCMVELVSKPDDIEIITGSKPQGMVEFIESQK